MKNRYVFLISGLSLFAGFLIGKNHVDFSLFPCLAKFLILLKEKKYLFEIVYLSIASLIIPIAYFQYRNEKKKEKKGAIEYAHKIFRKYSEEILFNEENFNQSFLQNLSLSGDKSEVNEFNKMLNTLDAIAAAFVHEIADSDAGKRMMGNTYCEQIQNYLPAIKRISGVNYKQGFENMFKLWDMWKGNNG